MSSWRLRKGIFVDDSLSRARRFYFVAGLAHDLLRSSRHDRADHLASASPQKILS